jgi:hypothetical protein
MVSKMMKLIYILVCVLVLVACDDDDYVSGEEKLDCSTNINNDPNCYGVNTHSTPLDGIEEYKSEVLGDDDVVTFRWDETLAWFLKSEDPEHQYYGGFDLDPYAMYSDDAPARGRDVYISVEKNENAWVTVYVPRDAAKVYHLHKVKKDGSIDVENIVLGADVCSKNKDGDRCKKDYPLPEGRYAVYYDEKDGKDEIQIDMQRYLHILGYNKKKYNIDFVQFGDALDDGCVIDGTGNGCYTMDWIQDRFNEVMSQAVVEGKFNSLDADEIGLDEYLTIDLTEQYESAEDEDTPVVGAVIDKIKNSEKYGYGKEQKALDAAAYQLYDVYCKETDGCVITVEIENGKTETHCECPKSERFTMLKNKKNEAEKNRDNAKARYRSKHLALGINRMRIQWMFEGSNNVILKNYSVFKQVAEQLGKSNSLKMILVEEGIPFGRNVTLEAVREEKNGSFSVRFYGAVPENKKRYIIYADVYPFVPGNPETAQITYLSPGFPITGGVVWGAHLIGDASLNTMVHEIGHTFGLTDLFIARDDPSYPGNYIEVQNGLIPRFAFDESNTMAWRVPNGKRLRYRPLFVAEGKGSRKKIGKDEDGKPIYATECQWDCMQQNTKCYRD